MGAGKEKPPTENNKIFRKNLEPYFGSIAGKEKPQTGNKNYYFRFISGD
ncbi:42981_t:CDS:2 [Gigaspora margarita]|uniref:42981_t:CDS:1 n=1 Tax=Gigaspora margarita TaxID=4874 RepID=A0ABN7WJB1_GIGMA|nr:42981_t:CDS:2 [Gigaspora margarita]